MSWVKLYARKDVGGIGFKDLKDFNMALLAKQGWRIFSSPGCLMAKLLKSKYFKNYSFLQADAGGSPSAI